MSDNHWLDIINYLATHGIDDETNRKATALMQAEERARFDFEVEIIKITSDDTNRCYLVKDTYRVPARVVWWDGDTAVCFVLSADLPAELYPSLDRRKYPYLRANVPRSEIEMVGGVE